MTKIKLPASVESERLILGSVLESDDLLGALTQQLTEDDFYHESHRIIFRALKSLGKTKDTIDVHIITEKLKADGQLEKIGGDEYIRELFQLSMHFHLYDDYVETVKENSVLRKLISFGQILMKECYNPKESISQFIDQKQIEFLSLTNVGFGKCGLTVQEVLDGEANDANIPIIDRFTEMQEYFKKNGKVKTDPSLIPSCYPDLDKIIEGFGNGQLILIAGNTGMGKTTFALNIIYNLAVTHNLPVGLFSLEMTSEEILFKLISKDSSVPLKQITSGMVDADEYTKVYGSIKSLEKKSLIIDETSSMTISTLRMRARRMKEMHGIKMIVIDYLQLLSGSTRSENRNVEVGQISRGLKTLAKELRIPIIALAQLSRKAKDKENKRPLLSDLRESGSLEQDADKVLFVHRPEYFDAHDKPGQAEIMVSKNRQGETGFCKLVFMGHLSSFVNYSNIEEDIKNDDNPYFPNIKEREIHSI